MGRKTLIWAAVICQPQIRTGIAIPHDLVLSWMLQFLQRYERLTDPGEYHFTKPDMPSTFDVQKAREWAAARENSHLKPLDARLITIAIAQSEKRNRGPLASLCYSL